LGKAWREANPEYHAEWKAQNPGYYQRWRESNPDYHKKYELKKKYGMTLEDFNKMVEEQGGTCLCGELFGDNKVDRPVVDHCHATGKIRAILHSRCNAFIGQRDPQILIRLRNK
jgi:hypothetical protein